MSSNVFESSGMKKFPKNKFDLSHEVKLSTNMGQLVPCFISEILPGDSFKVKTELMVRLAPLLAPLMHRVDVWTHFFFVPDRIIFDDAKDFYTGGQDGTIEPVRPWLRITDAVKASFYAGTLPDFLGVPPAENHAGGYDISAMPFRAYQQIYNDWFVDPNVGTLIDFSTKAGEVTGTATIEELVEIRTRAYEKDYFTSALPWPQRGGEAKIPIGDVTYLPVSPIIDAGTSNPYPSSTGLGTDPTGGLADMATGDLLRVENIESISATTINDLRKAEKLQEWLEISARGGWRYIEQNFAHFGVKSSDARLQRAEYLGGSKSPVNISEVLNTAGETGTLGELQPVGDMSGHGIAVGQSHGFKRSFEEHGYVIGIISVLEKTNYHQGLHRMWSRTSKFDYAWPVFANLGEQEVLNKEIYLDWANTPGYDEDAVWGYQQRFAEYKYINSRVAGEFHTSLIYWTMVRDFTSLPPLNEDFMIAEANLQPFASLDKGTSHLYIQLYHNVSAVRALPYHAIPSL